MSTPIAAAASNIQFQHQVAIATQTTQASVTLGDEAVSTAYMASIVAVDQSLLRLDSRPALQAPAAKLPAAGVMKAFMENVDPALAGHLAMTGLMRVTAQVVDETVALVKANNETQIVQLASSLERAPAIDAMERGQGRGSSGTASDVDRIVHLIKTNDKFALMVALMQVLLELAEAERNTASSLTNIERQATIMAGSLGVNAATQRLSGAIAGVGIAATMSAAQLRQSYKGSQVTVNSVSKNLGARSSTRNAVESSRTSAAGASNPPAGAMRPAQSLPTKDGGRVEVPAHAAPNRAQTAVINSDLREADIAPLDGAHNMQIAQSQNYYARAAVLGMATMPVVNLSAAGTEVAAAQTDAASKLAMNNASTVGKSAESRRDQALSNRQASQRAAEVLEALHQQDVATASHILGNMHA